MVAGIIVVAGSIVVAGIIVVAELTQESPKNSTTNRDRMSIFIGAASLKMEWLHPSPCVTCQKRMRTLFSTLKPLNTRVENSCLMGNQKYTGQTLPDPPRHWLKILSLKAPGNKSTSVQSAERGPHSIHKILAALRRLFGSGGWLLPLLRCASSF